MLGKAKKEKAPTPGQLLQQVTPQPVSAKTIALVVIGSVGLVALGVVFWLTQRDGNR